MINFAHIKPGMMVYDLGSGDGRLLFLAAKRGATAIGYEINPILVIYSEIIKLFSGCRHNIKFIWKDFWKANLENADIVFIYLLPWKMDRLKTILLYQLKPGALVISNSFIFPKWKIYQQDTLNHIYVFRV
jgi:SAM-dependent methyltransferase